MMGAMIDSKPLYVALAQRKEVRRAQLEQQFARSKLAPMQQMPSGGPMGFPQNQAPPFFYPQLFNAPQMMMGPRRGPWNQQQAQQQQLQGMMGVRPYPMMPNMGSPRMQQQMGAPQQRQMGRGRGGTAMQGGRGMQQQKTPMMQHQPMQQHPVMAQTSASAKTAAYTYTSQVRNVAMPTLQAHSASSSAASSAAVTGSTTATEESTQPMGEVSQTPLTSTLLAEAPEEQRKQLIGERLFPLIAVKQPKLAGKITGMLLEMDNGELLHLLENNSALSDKIDEALTVLRSSGVDNDDQPATETPATTQPVPTQTQATPTTTTAPATTSA
jgi:polyadenylate-binding protein